MLLKTAVKNEASDLHLTVNTRPSLRLNGKLVAIKTDVLSADEVEQLILSSVPPTQKNILEEKMELDYLYVLETGERFRVNAYKSQGHYEAVFRVVKSNVANLKMLNIPERVKDVVAHNNGLVLVAGATSSGKSTTLSALIDELNHTKEVRIITIENPVEVLHVNNKAVISQREVGVDTKDFPTALRSALRQDPDVIVIGEIRDRETAAIALEAAQTGHLVMSTLHAADTSDAINRYINLFPESDRESIKLMFSDSLRGVIAQRLGKDTQGHRVPVVELLINTLRVTDKIKGLESATILEIISNSGAQGMQTFEDHLIKLVAGKRMDVAEARKLATDESSLIIRLKKQGLMPNNNGH